MRMAHFGNPCIHCGIGHDDLPVGPCEGDPKRVKALRVGVIKQAWQNPVTQCDDIIVLMSDSWTRRESHHPSEHWRYSERLKDAVSVSAGEILKTEMACRSRSFSGGSDDAP